MHTNNYIALPYIKVNRPDLIDISVLLYNHDYGCVKYITDVIKYNIQSIIIDKINLFYQKKFHNAYIKYLKRNKLSNIDQYKIIIASIKSQVEFKNKLLLDLSSISSLDYYSKIQLYHKCKQCQALIKYSNNIIFIGDYIIAYLAHYNMAYLMRYLYKTNSDYYFLLYFLNIRDFNEMQKIFASTMNCNITEAFELNESNNFVYYIEYYLYDMIYSLSGKKLFIEKLYKYFYSISNYINYIHIYNYCFKNYIDLSNEMVNHIKTLILNAFEAEQNLENRLHLIHSCDLDIYSPLYKDINKYAKRVQDKIHSLQLLDDLNDDIELTNM